MKTVQDKDGKVIEVSNDTPCHAGQGSALPIMYDAVIDADIFAEMEARDAAAAQEKANYIANHKYKDDRKKAYGTWEEQMERLYWDQVNGTSTFKDHQDQVRLDIRKPGE